MSISKDFTLHTGLEFVAEYWMLIRRNSRLKMTFGLWGVVLDFFLSFKIFTK